MKLDTLQKHWDAMGRSDPCWAILTQRDKRGNAWDRREFLETGVREIGDVFQSLDQLHVQVNRGRALDFGCGVGRLTQALAPLFEHVDGIDIAPSMIDQARDYNQYGQRCTYAVNEHGDLRIFPDNTFDFIYTCRVLQHIEPRYVLGYLREFIRTLKPDGVLVFSQPSRHIPRDPYAMGYRGVKALIMRYTPGFVWRLRARYMYMTRGTPIMEAYVIPEDTVRATLQEAGARVIDVREDGTGGPGYSTLRYCVTKARRDD